MSPELLIAKSNVISLMSNLPEGLQDRAIQTNSLKEGVKVIEKILSEHQELKEDTDLLKRIYTHMKNSPDNEIRNFRMQLIYETYCSKKNKIIQLPEFLSDRDKIGLTYTCSSKMGLLVSRQGNNHHLKFSEEAFDAMDNSKLWECIKEQDVKELSIRLNNGSTITYKEAILKKLLDNEPSTEDMKTQYKIKFASGHELSVAKAKLLHCGEFFERMLNSSMKENEQREISLSESPVTFQSFCEILKSVETGEVISDDQACKLACDFLAPKLSNIASKIPEGAIGLEQWNSFYKFEDYGLEAKQKAPPIPENILKGLEGPSPYFEGKSAEEMRFTFLMPAGLTINTMEKLAKDHKLENRDKTGFRVCWDEIRKKYGDEPIKESYWVSATTEMLPKSGGLSREKQVKFEGFKNGDQASTLLEAIVLCFLMYHSKGERPFSKTYITCIEDPIKVLKLVVGGFSASGPYVYVRDDYSFVGVLGVRK